MSAYLSPKEAAKHLSVHYRTFLSIARTEGLLPDAVVGKRKRYRPETLRRLGELLRDRPQQRRTS